MNFVINNSKFLYILVCILSISVFAHANNNIKNNNYLHINNIDCECLLNHSCSPAYSSDISQNCCIQKLKLSLNNHIELNHYISAIHTAHNLIEYYEYGYYNAPLINTLLDEYISVLQTMSELYYNLGNYNQALLYLNKAYRLYPTSSYIAYKLGQIHIKQHKYTEAEKTLQHAIQLNILHNERHKNFELLTLLKHILIQESKYDEAQTILSRHIITHTSFNEEELYAYTQYYGHIKDYYNTALVSEQLLNKNNIYRRNYKFIEQYSDALLHLGRQLDATQLWNQFINYNPTDMRALFHLIDIDIIKNQSKNTEKYLEVISNYLNHQDQYDIKNLDITNKYLDYKAKYLLAHGRMWQAASIYQELINNNLNNMDINYPYLYSLANIYLNIGQNNQALKIYKELEIYKANDFFTIFNQGVLYSALNQPLKAIVKYKQSLDINNQYPDTYYSLGELFFELGDLEESKSYWKKYIKLAPRGIYSSRIYDEFPSLVQ